MGLRLTVNGVELPNDRTERFFAIRIGTGPANDIVVSENTPGVQEHHCTIVHTGSTYRLEMLPTHLVFVDGERGECGQQLFLHNTSSCTSFRAAATRQARLAPLRRPRRLVPCAPPRLVTRSIAAWRSAHADSSEDSLKERSLSPCPAQSKRKTRWPRRVSSRAKVTKTRCAHNFSSPSGWQSTTAGRVLGRSGSWTTPNSRRPSRVKNSGVSGMIGVNDATASRSPDAGP